MKLSKQQIKLHEEAMEYVNSDEKLNHGEKKFILENFQESYQNVNSKFGAFFTPYDIARDLSVEVPDSGSIIDLCAGIGMLSYAAHNANFDERKIVCVELNPQYVKVGKRILPEATWICGSILDHELIESLGKFTCAISNPPFGTIANNKQNNSWNLNYKGSDFEYMTIEIASKIARYGVFVLPQTSCNFQYSGTVDGYKEVLPKKYEKFTKETGLEMEGNCGIDTSHSKDCWKGVNIQVEIATFNFPIVKELEAKQQQLSLF